MKDMKKLMICAASLVAAIPMFSQNLLRDDFIPDGRGGIVDWAPAVETKYKITRLEESGPEGKPVLRMDRQSGIFVATVGHRLVAGEPYSFSVYVRTKGLTAKTDAKWVFQDIRGLKGKVELALPLDTGGQWQKLEWNGPCTGSLDGLYYWRLSFTGHIVKDAYIDICKPEFLAQSDLARRKSSPASDNGPYVGRVTPVCPELCRINASDAKVELYYPEELDKPQEDYVFRAVIAGKSAQAEPDARHRATLSLGSVPAGDITLVAEIVGKTSGKVLRSNAYQGKAIIIPSNPTQGKKLNNFVTELWTSPLANGSREFIIDKDRQVYVCTDKLYKGVVLKIDGQTILTDKKEGLPEAMCRLSMGTHSLTVEGVSGKAAKGTISLRLIKDIGSESVFYSVERNPRFINYRFGPDFFKRMGYFEGFNQFTFNVTKVKDANKAYDLLHSIEAKGARITMSMGLIMGSDPCRFRIPQYIDTIKAFQPFNENKEVLFHENKIFDDLRKKYNASEVWWKLNVPGKHLGLYVEDGNHCTFNVPEFDTPMLAAWSNSGSGDNLMVEESYYASYPSEEMTRKKLDFIRQQAIDRNALVPTAMSHTMFLFNGWLKIGSWTRWNYPQVDLKAYYARILQMMATDPAFEEIGGVSFSTPSCEEDIFRFVTDAFRYYCIEGKTGNYADQYGLSLINNHIDNGDFDQKGEGWTSHELTENGVRFKTIKGFGTGPQRRCKDRTPIFKPDAAMGDNFVVLAPGGNAISQKIKNLEKGKYYQLVFCSFDYNQFVAKKKIKDPKQSCIDVVLKGKLLEYPEMTQVSGRRTNKSRLQGMVYSHRLVFKATGNEAELEFIHNGGTKHMWGVNYVGVRPYYVKDKAQFNTLLQLYVESEQQ